VMAHKGPRTNTEFCLCCHANEPFKTRGILTCCSDMQAAASLACWALLDTGLLFNLPLSRGGSSWMCECVRVWLCKGQALESSTWRVSRMHVCLGASDGVDWQLPPLPSLNELVTKDL
jgi:hypothetical protein